jgi:hypothetical protein
LIFAVADECANWHNPEDEAVLSIMKSHGRLQWRMGRI